MTFACFMLASCDFLLSRPSDKYVTEQIANMLGRSVDEVDVDFDNMETVDMKWGSSQSVVEIKEKNSNKTFKVVYDGIDVVSVEFAN